ncbi:MAG: DUF4388 domain-containing protein [Oscillochloris sp.]|nr:DUF4388 domain-containing protein [Oscillochloris sp.]
MGLEGKIADMPILNVLRSLLRSTSSGKLVVWNQEQWALVWLMNGHAVSAVVLHKPDRRPLQTGEQAIFRLFEWNTGFFSFSPDTEESANYPITIKRPTGALIIEAIQRDTPPPAPATESLLQVPIQLLPQIASSNERVNLSMEEWYVLTHIGQQSTPEHLATKTGLPADRVLRIVDNLIGHGLVIRAPKLQLGLSDLPSEPTAQRSAIITNLMRAVKRRLEQIEFGA